MGENYRIDNNFVRLMGTVQAELVLGTYRLANEGPFGISIEAQTIY